MCSVFNIIVNWLSLGLLCKLDKCHIWNIFFWGIMIHFLNSFWQYVWVFVVGRGEQLQNVTFWLSCLKKKVSCQISIWQLINESLPLYYLFYSTADCFVQTGIQDQQEKRREKGKSCFLVGSFNFKHKSGSFSFPHRLNLLLTSLLNLSSGLCIYSADRLSAALSVFVVIHCLTDCLGTHTADGFVQ